MRHSSFCVVLGLAMLPVAAAVSGPAHATAVTVGTNYQETSNRQSLSPPTAAVCHADNHCYIIFNIIPAGKQLLVTDVSCRLQVLGNNADNLFRIELGMRTTTGEASDRSTFLSPVLTKAKAANNLFFAINGTTRQLYKAGERPVVLFMSDQDGSFNPACTIMGKVGNPPE